MFQVGPHLRKSSLQPPLIVFLWSEAGGPGQREAFPSCFLWVLQSGRGGGAALRDVSLKRVCLKL